MARWDDDPNNDGGDGGPGPSAGSGGDGGSSSLYAAVAQMYKTALGRDGSPTEINGWINSIGGKADRLGEIQQGIYGSEEAKRYSAKQTSSGSSGSTGGSGGGGGGGNGISGPLTDPFSGTFSAPPERTGPPSYLPNLPEFHGPAWKTPPAFSYDAFKAPSYEEAVSDPGYQFALKQGEGALANAAGAKGLTRTGGTLKDFVNYGQAAATQQYGGVVSRDLGIYNTNRSNAVDTYNTNYQTQYVDPYKMQYQSAWDAFQPQLLQYSTQAQAGQRQSELDYDRSWQRYLNAQDYYRNWQNDTWNKQFQYANS